MNTKEIRLLILVNELLITCGVTKHIENYIAELKKNTNLIYTIICSGGDNVERFSKNSEVVVLEYLNHNNRSIKNFIVGIINIIKIAKKKNINIIHSHHHYLGNIAEIASKYLKVNTVFSNHGLLPEVGILPHFPGKNIIAVNEHAYNYISDKYKNKNIRLIRYGISVENISIQKNGKLTFIAGGRLVDYKGFDTYIKATAELPDELKNKADFLLAGSGEEKDNLLALIDRLKSPVKYIGEVKEFSKMLAKTHVFINPSRSKTEGFPTVLIEAGLTKNLIVSSRFYGFDSVFNEKTDGLFFDNDQVDSLKQIILNITLNKIDFEYFTNNVYKNFQVNYDFKKNSDMINKLYQKIINE